MSFLLRHLPEVISTVLGLAILTCAGAWALGLERYRSLRHRVGIIIAVTGGCALLVAGLALRAARVARFVPPDLRMWIGTSALMLVLLLICGVVTFLLSRVVPRSRTEYSLPRRRFLLAARTAVFAAPAAAAGYAVFIQRHDINASEITIPIAGLPKELESLRLVQVSDIHLSPFLSERELARAIDLSNEFNAHIALVTGDLITGPRDPLDTCIRQLTRLRSEMGIIGCLGNHEVYADAEDYTTQEGAKHGISFLRSQSRVFTWRGRKLNFAGVDYQRMKEPYLEGAQKLIQPGMPNILLSHNPDVFPVAAAQGFDLTISGHTHGGQISVEILNQSLNVARFYTPYVYGRYTKGNSSVYVTRGIGTVGIPARLGAPPEIAFIRLCAI